MRALIDDLRYAVRQLAARPIFSVAAVVSLALGLGANTTIFGVTNALLLRPMDVPRPDEMVKVYSWQHSPFILADLEYFRSHVTTMTHLIAEDQFPATLRVGAEPERVVLSVVTGDFWQALELTPQAGRLFARARNDASAEAPVAVISDAFWRRRFGADRSIVGRSLRLGAATVEVVGVAPPGFGSSIYGFASDAWVPMSDAGSVIGVPAATLGGGLYATGRLRPGASRAQAHAELQVLMARLKAERPEGHERMTVRVDHARGITAEDRGPAMMATAFLLAVTGLVLLIACANVGNLLLARNAARRREIGVRVALGATPQRILRQLLSESVVLAAAAGASGLLVAAWLGRLLVRLIPEGAPVSLTIPVDGRVLAYGIAASLVAVLAFGLAPALRARSLDLSGVLGADSRSVAGRRSRLRHAFLLVQVAFSTVLLAVALLFVRSLGNARNVDTGVNASNLVSVGVNLRLGRYDQQTGSAFFERITENMRALPMVRSAATAATVPLSGSRIEYAYYREGDAPVAPDAPRPTADVNNVSPSYFATMDIPLLRGRDFTRDDRAGSPQVVIVNRTMADRLWPGADAIGKRLSFAGQQGPWVEVVGVVRDIKYNALGESPTPVMYLPHAQQYRDHMLVQVRLAPGSTISAARRALLDLVSAADPTLPPAEFQTVAEAQQLSLLPSRIGAAVLGAFGTLALLLASVGIFGVAAFAVAQRTREIGIRSALGARSGAVIRSVLGDTMRTVAIGGALGLAAALGAAQLLRGQLYGLAAVDPITFTSIPLVQGILAAVAAAIPARRAARVDPVIALRAE